MIIKERQKSLELQKLEALLRRLPENHQKRPIIKVEWAKSRAGFTGERSFDHHLRNLPAKNYLILNDIRLKSENGYFQIDTLLLSSKFFVIAEVKNLSGELYFDPNYPQLIQIKNGIEKAYPDPRLQVKTQQRKLKSWLENHSFTNISIHPLVIQSAPHSTVRTTNVPKSVFEKVIPSANFIYKIEEIEILHKTTIMTEKELKKIAKLIIKSHTPLDTEMLKQFDIPKTDLIQGVFCPECASVPMERYWGKWRCNNCQCISKDAHLNALKDYALLIGKTITLEKFKDHMKISSPSSSSKLLTSLHLHSEGRTRDRIYDLSNIQTIIK